MAVPEYKGVILLDTDGPLLKSKLSSLLGHDPNSVTEKLGSNFFFEPKNQILVANLTQIKMMAEICDKNGVLLAIGSQRFLFQEKDGEKYVQKKEAMFKAYDAIFPDDRKYLNNDQGEALQKALETEYEGYDADYLNEDKSPLLRAVQKLEGCEGLSPSKFMLIDDYPDPYQDAIVGSGAQFVEAPELEPTTDYIYEAMIKMMSLKNIDKAIEASSQSSEAKALFREQLNEYIQAHKDEYHVAIALVDNEISQLNQQGASSTRINELSIIRNELRESQQIQTDKFQKECIERHEQRFEKLQEKTDKLESEYQERVDKANDYRTELDSQEKELESLTAGSDAIKREVNLLKQSLDKLDSLSSPSHPDYSRVMELKERKESRAIAEKSKSSCMERLLNLKPLGVDAERIITLTENIIKNKSLLRVENEQIGVIKSKIDGSKSMLAQSQFTKLEGSPINSEPNKPLTTPADAYVAMEVVKAKHVLERYMNNLTSKINDLDVGSKNKARLEKRKSDVKEMLSDLNGGKLDAKQALDNVKKITGQSSKIKQVRTAVADKFRQLTGRESKHTSSRDVVKAFKDAYQQKTSQLKQAAADKEPSPEQPTPPSNTGPG